MPVGPEGRPVLPNSRRTMATAYPEHGYTAVMTGTTGWPQTHAKTETIVEVGAGYLPGIPDVMIDDIPAGCMWPW